MRASSGAWRARHRWRSTPARGQVPPTLRARCPAVPTASYHRLSVSTATVSVSMVTGRILAAWRSWRATVDEDGHYSFAVPLGCRSPPCAPIGRFATPCDLALRLVGGRPAGIATWSAYPSIAAAPINPRIDVMGHKGTPTIMGTSGYRKSRLAQAVGEMCDVSSIIVGQRANHFFYRDAGIHAQGLC
jgi:hypothetical protein